MAHLVDDFPFLYCLVRNEFLYDQDETKIGEYTEACVIGVVALEGRVPSFTVMLRNGALWARLPIHALTMYENDPLPLSVLCLWDCLSYDVTVHQYAYLESLRADVFCSDGIVRSGEYLVTLDWCKSNYSEMADQHKQHHIIKLDSGHLAAMPGNRLRWHEPSWIRPFSAKPDYKVLTDVWTTEREKALVDSDKWAYGVVGDTST